ncbi:glucosamine-6-phosphate deaminase [Magnetospirillum sp. UT-4]|uniref:glucosamine-6-phosphate deaminase n=1 Tax=Magnetospirillum sp. UT-4 TaxID=2681467 RepID=UPI00137D2F8B|nr:glucosamine-6-phosphate deaminase [Magnetospirillum sp. UT-4]CAA7614648.1 Glucosamine-6-phosphate deaminase [Magnetospirillum sp. UT-4]
MLILIHPDAESACATAARLLAELIRSKPDAVLGLAAGATPLPAYDRVVAEAGRGLECSRLTVFGLDEYEGVSPDHPAACTRAILDRFVRPLRLGPERVHLLVGDGGAEARCAAHEAAIRAAGGIDLQVLGLGVNGHVGFNEPGCSLAGPTRRVALSARTRAVNGPGFGGPEAMPATALSMGLGTILAARRILLMATGGSKAEAVASMAEGPVTAMVPASALQTHAAVVAVVDEAAAARLRLGDDYRRAAALLAASPW